MSNLITAHPNQVADDDITIASCKKWSQQINAVGSFLLG